MARRSGRSGRLRQASPYGRVVDVAGESLRVEVDRRRPTGRRLLSGLIEASYVDLADPAHLEFEYVRRMGDVIDLAWPAQQPLAAIHLGGGACTLARYLAATRPRSRSEVYEHDARVVELAQRELGLRLSRALRVRVGDARELLARRGDATADLIVGDAFEGIHVPSPLLALDCAVDVARVLTPGGVYTLNLIDSPPLRVVRQQVTNLLGVFTDVLLVATPRLLAGKAGGNLVLAAGNRALPVAELAERAERATVAERVLDRSSLEHFVADG